MKVRTFAGGIFLSVTSFTLLAFLLSNNVGIGVVPYIVSVVAVACGVITIIFVGFSTGSPFAPLPLFTTTWLIAGGLTSQQVAVFLPLEQEGWIVILIVVATFSFGCALASLLRTAKYTQRSVSNSVMIKPLIELYGPYILVIAGIAAILVMALLAGGFPALSEEPWEARRGFAQPLLSFFSSIGALGLFLTLASKWLRHSRVLWILFAIYSVLLALTATRWSVIFLGLIFLSHIALRRVDKKLFVKIGLMIVILLVFFYSIQWIRGGTLAAERYYTRTGLYEGSPLSFFLQMPLLYITASFRLLEQYFLEYPGGLTMGKFTLFPILSAVQLDTFVEFPPVLSIFGFNARPFAVEVYLDFGWCGLIIFPFLWGFMTTITFYQARLNPRSLWWMYAWTISFASLVLAPLAYLSDYAFWVFHFPIVLAVFRLIDVSVRAERLGHMRVVLQKTEVRP